jgi:cytoskeletal protein RodZ
VSIGGELAQARRLAGLSVADVSQRTRIREPIVRSIEDDDFAGCGGDFYARGFIRAIARVVGTDAAPLIQEYDAGHAPPPAAAGAVLPRPAGAAPPGTRRRPGLILLLALAVAVAVLGGYQLISASGPAPRATSEAGNGVLSGRHHAVSPVPPAPSPVARRIIVRLTAAQDCWVEFTTPGGRYLFQAYLPAGRSRRWIFRHPVDMAIGNPGGVTLMVNGRRPLPAGVSHPVTLHLTLSGGHGQ